MGIGSYEDALQAEVRQREPGLQLDRVEVGFLAAADKSDPFNARAVMTAKAVIRGQSGAWIVEGRNGEPGETAGRLLRALAAVIAQKPGQTLGEASTNIVKLD